MPSITIAPFLLTNRVLSLIDENRHRRIRSSVGDTLRYLFMTSGLSIRMGMIFAVSRPVPLAQYTALVEFHKHQQPGFAEILAAPPLPVQRKSPRS